jgi:hypothetical protein
VLAAEANGFLGDAELGEHGSPLSTETPLVGEPVDAASAPQSERLVGLPP